MEASRYFYRLRLIAVVFSLSVCVTALEESGSAQDRLCFLANGGSSLKLLVPEGKPVGSEIGAVAIVGDPSKDVNLRLLPTIHSSSLLFGGRRNKRATLIKEVRKIVSLNEGDLFNARQTFAGEPQRREGTGGVVELVPGTKTLKLVQKLDREVSLDRFTCSRVKICSHECQ